uniref:Immunoglobulin V-set domain-containing protein n=1 Tax=Esox lucius TaxID=8010 RepID=A0A6Q2Y826_ESOLU
IIKSLIVLVFIYMSINILSFSPGSPPSDQVHQSPADLFKNQGDSAEMQCSHNILNYDRILLYKQDVLKRLTLLGYVYSTSGYPEPGVNIQLTGNANKGGNSTFTINQLAPNSSAVYFCAASYTVNQISLSALQKPPP